MEIINPQLNVLLDKSLINKKNIPKAKKRNRVWEVDLLRGLCIIMMLMDHMLFNFAYVVPGASNWWTIRHPFFVGMHDIAIWYWTWNVRHIVRLVVVFLFIYLSGISCSFSRDNKQRFLKMGAAASIVTIVTYGLESIMAMPPSPHANDFSFFIIFGILHIMAFNIGIFVLIEKVFKNIKRLSLNRFSPFIDLISNLAIIILGAGFLIGGFFIPFWVLGSNGVVRLDGLFDLNLYYWIMAFSFLTIALFSFFFIKRLISKKRVPRLIFNLLWSAIAITGTALLFFILPAQAPSLQTFGYLLQFVSGTGRIGADFYGAFPFLGVFLIGAGLGGIVYKNKRSLIPWVDGKYMMGCFVGRHAIWMYLAHQVVFFLSTIGAAMLVGYIFF